MAPLCAVLLFSAIAASSSPSAAGPFTVTAGDQPRHVMIEASDASVDAILAELAETHGFTIERPISDISSRTWSGHYEGALSDALARLLENENYVLEHSRGAKSGIARVKLFATDRTAQDTTTVSRISGQATPPAAVAPQPAAKSAAAPVPQSRNLGPLQTAAAAPREVRAIAVATKSQPAARPTAPVQPALRRRGGLIQ